jgi:hypothetical protein
MLSPYAKSSALGLYLPLTGGTLTGGLTGTTGAFTSSGSDNTYNITHSSGSGIALNITKGGNGEGLYVNKTSGTGNAATIVGTLNATTLVKSGGTSTQYLMADGTTSTLTNPVTGLGITGYIPKWTSSSALDSSQLFQSAGFVSIGNTSPAYKLDITGTLRNTTGAAFATTSGNVLVGTTVDASIKLDVAGNMRSTLGANFATTSGSVGVGTTSPIGKFTVKNATDYNTVFQSAGGFSAIQSLNDAASAYKEMRIDGIYMYLGGFSGGETFIGSGTTDAGNYKLQVKGQMHSTGATALAVDSGSLTVGTIVGGGNKVNVEGGMAVSGFSGFATTSGNVGVGQTGGNATEKLDVNGRARVRTIDSTGTGTAMNMLYSDATGVIKKAAVPSGGITGTGITGYFPKWTGTATQDTSQLFQLGRNIGIGTASPTFRLHLPDAGSTANQAMIAGTIFGSDGNGITISPNSSNITIKGGQGNGSIYSGTISSVARWGINTTSISDAVFSVNGDVKIVTVDSTATAVNMIYQDANGIIKKSAALSMSDDVMTVAGSWVVTKDAGSGFSINNVAYTTNGTTKMVTIDGAFYITAELFSDGSWDDVATIPSGFRPQKTVNWTNNFIVSGAEYETSGGTDFTGALSWTYAQMRVTDEGKVQINASIDTNTIDAGGAEYVVIQFTQTYIIK